MAARQYKIGQHPLVEFEWDPSTGAAGFVYDDGLVVVTAQPMAPDHNGWRELGQRPMQVAPGLLNVGTRAGNRYV